MDVETPRCALSPAPTRSSTELSTESVAAPAGTGEPTCAMAQVVPGVRVYVGLPPMSGPMMIWKCKAPHCIA